MAGINLHTGPGVFAVLANVCRNPLEAIKQFVENAADAIEQAKIEDGHISVQLKYQSSAKDQGKKILKNIIIRDNGIGMSQNKMHLVLQHIGDSEKINLALRGEQGIGILAFALLGEELHLSSTAKEGFPSSCLILRRAWLREGRAEIREQCRTHQHSDRGTVAIIKNISSEIAAQLSKDRLKNYLGQQFTSDLKANLYNLSISDDDEFEQINPQRFRGMRIISTKLSLGHSGSAFLELYVLPWDMSDATTSLYGRGGTRICSLTDLDDFKKLPWTDHRLEGYIRCDLLTRTADKTTVVQDKTYQDFVSALQKLEPEIRELIMKVSTESQEQRFNVVLNRAGKLIDRFLRYRERGLLTDLNFVRPELRSNRGETFAHKAETRMKEKEEVQAGCPMSRPILPPRKIETRAPHIRLYSPPADNANYRSWYDPSQELICINREHTEFLLAQRDERRCMRYLFSIWAKESLLQEYGPQAEKIADEMVGVLAEAEPLLW